MLYIVSALASLLLLAGCANHASTTALNAPHGLHQAPVKNLAALHKVARDMVVDLVNFTPIITLTAHEKPPVAIEDIQNRTAHWVDTTPLSQTIADTLYQSGRFSIIHDYKGNWETKDDKLAYYDLSGELTQQTDGYILTLRLRNQTTGLLVWQDSSAVAKT